MANKLVNLFDAFISIEKNGKLFFHELSKLPGIDDRVRILARVFEKEEERHMVVYESIRESNRAAFDLDVDKEMYIKAVKLIDQFNWQLASGSFTGPKELLRFALNFENENLVLVLYIKSFMEKQGIHVVDETLNMIVDEERRHIQNIEDFLLC